MNSLQRLQAAVNFEPCDRPPFADNEWNDRLVEIVPHFSGCLVRADRCYSQAERAAAVRASTIPQLKDVTEFYAVVSVITMLAWVFPFVYVMTRGGPGNASTVMELYIYNFAFRNALPGIAAAVAVVLFLITLALMIPIFQLRARNQLEVAE
jgi:hypothetical protein